MKLPPIEEVAVMATGMKSKKPTITVTTTIGMAQIIAAARYFRPSTNISLYFSIFGGCLESELSDMTLPRYPKVRISTIGIRVRMNSKSKSPAFSKNRRV